MNERLINSSFKYCLKLAANHYENFPVASLLIPKEKRKFIASVYAFARIADDFADEPDIDGGREKRLALLDEWLGKLKDCYNDKTYDPVFIALNETRKKFDIPFELFENLLRAFKQDVVKNRYNDFNEVLDYCTNSANPIGRLVLYIFRLRDEEWFRLSDNICTALQLTNFWQDVSIDIEKDRIYIPVSDIKDFGYSEEELKNKKTNYAFRSLIKFEVERTRKYFKEGFELLIKVKESKLSRRLFQELKLTWFGGMEILNNIENSGYDVLKNRQKLNRKDFIKLFFKKLK